MLAMEGGRSMGKALLQSIDEAVKIFNFTVAAKLSKKLDCIRFSLCKVTASQNSQ